MKGYYLFSDECGSYQKERSRKFKERHPFYVRASVLIKFEDYIELEKKIDQLKENLDIDSKIEIKWSEIGNRFNGRKTEGMEHIADETIIKP